MADDSRIEKRKKERQSGEGENSEFWSYVTLIGIAGIIVVISYFLFFSGGAAADVEPWDDVQAIDADDPTMVAAGASEDEIDDMVEVVYYGDFECPACVQFERDVFPTMKDDYIATGDVKFVFKPVDFIGTSDSANAALGARSVWDQNQTAYWQWHRIMFANFEQRGNWASPSNIGDFATQAGADGNSIAQSVEQAEHAADIQRHRSEAQSAGVQGTPSFVIEDTLVTGGDYAEISSEIDANLEG